MNSEEKDILTEYKKKQSIYNELESHVLDILNQLVKDNDCSVMDIAHRVKSVESLEKKIKKKTGKYKEITDITDLCGFRIICYFSDSLEILEKEIRRLFIIDKDNSVDKGKLLRADQFGYLSIHYICSLPDKKYEGIPFEIQLRTVLQHCWAEIEHDLGYKNDFGKPKNFVRDFSRIAGLLEIADEQFVKLRREINNYVEDTHNKIITGNADDVVLDIISLREMMRHNIEVRDFIHILEAENNIRVDLIEADAYIPQFEWFGIQTVGALLAFGRRNLDLAYEIIKDRIREFDLDIMSSNMILRYICHAELINGEYSEDKIKEFLYLSSQNKGLIEQETKKILKAQKEN